MSRVIKVTGSNGFIGRRLVSQLEDSITIPHEKIQTTDFGDATDVFFLSAYGNMASHGDDGEILKANIEDLVHVVKTVDFNRIRSFVFFSTSSVKLPIQTMYSRTKHAGEDILLSFAEKYNAPISIIRPFSVTGVGEQESHLIPTLIRSCIDGEAMRLVPSPVHDFIDVSDVVDGVLTLSDRRFRGIFELGSGIQYSNDDVRKIVEKVTGKKANVTQVQSMRPYDTFMWVSTNNKLSRAGWVPKKTLEDSITEMVEDYVKRSRKKDN